MPTYQYACTSCGHRLEVIQKFTDDPLTECPDCHGHLRKVFSPVGVVFKGSGFYKTDSRGSSTGPRKDTGAGTAGKEKAAAGATGAEGSAGAGGSGSGFGGSGSSGSGSGGSGSGGSGSGGGSSKVA